MGYGRRVNEPNTNSAEEGDFVIDYPHPNSTWFPAPLLSYLGQMSSVEAATVQPLWLRVRLGRFPRRGGRPAAFDLGELRVTAEAAAGRASERIAVRARVFNFSLPVEQHLPTIFGNGESTIRNRYGDSSVRNYVDFLVQNRVAVNDLYATQGSGQLVGPPPFDNASRVGGWPIALSSPAAMRRLWQQGQRIWVLGGLSGGCVPRNCIPTKDWTNSTANMTWEAFMPRFFGMMRAALRVTDAAGWPRKNVVIYLFDETHDYKLLANTTAQVHAELPGVSVITAAPDTTYGLGSQWTHPTHVDISVVQCAAHVARSCSALGLRRH